MGSDQGMWCKGASGASHTVGQGKEVRTENTEPYVCPLSLFYRGGDHDLGRLKYLASYHVARKWSFRGRLFSLKPLIFNSCLMTLRVNHWLLPSPKIPKIHLYQTSPQFFLGTSEKRSKENSWNSLWIEWRSCSHELNKQKLLWVILCNE